MVVTNWHFLSLIAANKKWRFGVNDVKRLVAVRCTECDTWTWRWRPFLFKHLRSFCRRVFICCGLVSSLANSTTTSAGRLTCISDTDKLLQGRDNKAIVYETSWYEERTVNWVGLQAFLKGDVQWFYLVVKVNCSLSDFNIIKSIWLLKNIKNKSVEKKSESAHPMICLLFASDGIIPGARLTKSPTPNLCRT